MKVLIAPDKFKGSLTARQAAEAIAAGVRAVVADAMIDLCPLADGGEGMLDTLITSAGGTIEQLKVCGPLPGMVVSAPIGWLKDGKTAVVELASASGLELLRPEQRDPVRTTTYGTGELIAHAVRRGARRIIVGIGGSATCDGGLGMAQACGAIIRLSSGKRYAAADRKITGGDVGKVISISRQLDEKSQPAANLLRFAGVEIIVAADVGNPLCGADGAAHVFAPQKGATPAQVRQLDEGLRSMSERLDLIDIARAPAAGAGGGAAFGLMALFGGTAVSGAQMVLDQVKLEKRLKGVDLCFTGEGRFDRQSLSGKAPMAVTNACRAAKVPCVVLAGSLGDGWEDAYKEGVTAALSILRRPMALVEAQEHAAELLAAAAEAAIRLWRSGRKRPAAHS